MKPKWKHSDKHHNLQCLYVTSMKCGPKKHWYDWYIGLNQNLFEFVVMRWSNHPSDIGSFSFEHLEKVKEDWEWTKFEGIRDAIKIMEMTNET